MATKPTKVAARPKGFMRDVEIFFAKSQFNGEVRGKFYRKLSSLLKNGVPAMQALELLYSRASDNGKNRGAPMAVVLESIIQVVRSGGSLGSGLKQWIPTAEGMLLQAGERSGSLEESMISAVEVMDSGARMKAAVKGGLAYPAILFAAAMGVLLLFGLKVIPEFARVADPKSWTGVAAMMYSLSTGVQVYTIPAVILLGVVITVMVVSLPRLTGTIRIKLDAFPPFSIYRISVGSGFMISLSALVKAGVPLEKALQELRHTATPYLAERIQATVMGLRSGVNFGEALNRAGHKFPDQEIIDDITIYASLSGFDKAMETVAKEWLEKGVEDVNAKAKALNGAAMAFMGGVIGFLVYGMISIQQIIAAGVQGG